MKARKHWTKVKDGDWVFWDGTKVYHASQCGWMVRWPVSFAGQPLAEGVAHLTREQAMRHVEEGRPSRPWIRPDGGTAQLINEDLTTQFIAEHRRILKAGASTDGVRHDLEASISIPAQVLTDTITFSTGPRGGVDKAYFRFQVEGMKLHFAGKSLDLPLAGPTWFHGEAHIDERVARELLTKAGALKNDPLEGMKEAACG